MVDSEAISKLGDQLFSRTAGAPLVRGNAVRLLRDAAENYPAWLDTIREARRSVHFEDYIIHDDDVGQRFGAVLTLFVLMQLTARADWGAVFAKR